MNITNVKADNFKSLVDFEMRFAKFNCLVGLNGAGKSTLLQFIDFLGQQMRGDLKEWLKNRGWKASDINSKLIKSSNVDFEVKLASEDGTQHVCWKASFNRHTLRCTTELIETRTASIEVKDRLLVIKRVDDIAEHHRTERNAEKIRFAYEGSILSQLRDEDIPGEKNDPSSLLGLKHFFAAISSLDMLSPERLRRRTRDSSGTLGLGGQNLSSYLHEMARSDQQSLLKKLTAAYPQLFELRSKALRSGWKQLEIVENFELADKSIRPLITTSAHHINDGMLRLIAILVSLHSEQPFLLFDEIENGINPELIEFVLDEMVDSPQQIVVTTHSPMILNYLDDNIAREGVTYLYKDQFGKTRSIPFFSIPSMSEKLNVMGPGEAYVDTDLSRLVGEIRETVGTR